MRLVLGWPNDQGLGARLCQQVLEGRKTATTAPGALLHGEELAEALGGVGQVIPLVDGGSGEQRGWVLKTGVHETMFGAPDEALWRGEGYDTPEAFQESHRHVFEVFGFQIRDDTVLLYETFCLAAAPES